MMEERATLKIWKLKKYYKYHKFFDEDTRDRVKQKNIGELISNV